MYRTPEIHIVGSRRKAVTSLLCLIAFAFAALWLTQGTGTARHSAESQHFVGWVGLVTVGFLIPWFAIWTARPPLLIIDDVGFRVKQPWKSVRLYRWDDIDQIWASSFRDQSSVVWTFREGAKPKIPTGFGYDGFLSGMWTLTGEEMASELNTAMRVHREKCA
jgi:hypothetical protein